LPFVGPDCIIPGGGRDRHGKEGKTMQKLKAQISGLRGAGRWAALALGAVVLAGAATYWARGASADKAPGPLYYAGVLKGADGTPLGDRHDIDVRMFDTETGGSPVCATSAPGTAVTDGHFRVELGADCVAAAHAYADLWIEVVVDDTTLPRTRLGAVPWALVAETASSAAGDLDERLAKLEDAAYCPRLVAYDGTFRAYEKDLSTPGVVRCTFGRDKMVKVGSFWVDQHEALLVPGTFWNAGACDGTGSPYASTGGASPTDDYPSTFPDTGNWTVPVYACSVAADPPSDGWVPSRMMTWFQAEQACLLAGKRLCTNAEWQAAVAGTNDPGSYDGTLGGSCHTNGAGPRKTGMAGTVPGASASCISRWGAEDMIGNLWESVADWGQTGRGWATTDEAAATPWPTGYGEDRTWNLNGRAYSEPAGWTDGLPAAGHRGGSWGHGTSAGAFTMYLASGPTVWAPTVGVRCCAGAE
jgi:formylglycine-generating enzyme required for sulfatase activity